MCEVRFGLPSVVVIAVTLPFDQELGRLAAALMLDDTLYLVFLLLLLNLATRLATRFLASRLGSLSNKMGHISSSPIVNVERKTVSKRGNLQPSWQSLGQP